MADDAQLLRLYVETKSEPAFAELVQRHLSLVYHTAVRQLGADRHLAEDVTQSVFVLLAEKSRSLLAHSSLAGWLHSTAHFKVARALRAEQRRRGREQTAFAMSEFHADDSAAEWEKIRPVLDAALLELNATDREALLLRFFEDRPFAEIGERLQLKGNTAHKRVDRALEKLREQLTRRGITSSAAALGSLLGAQSALAVPNALAAVVSNAVALSATPASASWVTLVIMNAKITTGLIATAALLSGVVGFELHEKRLVEVDLVRAERETAALQFVLRDEQTRAASLAKSVVTPPRGRSVALKSATTTAAEADFAERLEKGRQFLKTHPEFRELLSATKHTELMAQYADLFVAMGLSKTEREQFLEIEMKASARIIGDAMFCLADAMPTGDEMVRQLRALLGNTRYQQFKEFERGEERKWHAQQVTSDLTRTLYYTSTPMAPAQLEQMNRLITDTLADRTLGPKVDVGMAIPIPFWDRILTQARFALSGPQLEVLNDLHQRAIFSSAERDARRAAREKTK